MKIAIYSRPRNGEEKGLIEKVVNYLSLQGCDLLLHQNRITDGMEKSIPSYVSYEDLAQHKDINFLFSIGGDGTFIDAANLVGNLAIPIVGINTGRIGFLAGINQSNFEASFELLKSGAYTIEERSLLHLECNKEIALGRHFALNDITVRTSDENSINAITVWINKAKVNTYWADGLIIATPTGSTAYSLSCGGPIIVPSTQVNVLTPIASHTLGVRPIVIPAEVEIKIVVESRHHNFSLALDSQRVVIENPVELSITKEKFSIKTLLFHSTDFYSIIREKLLWGIDKRNENKNR